MKRIDAIVSENLKELEKRHAEHDTGGLSALHLYMRFRGDTRAPAAVVVKVEYKSREEQRSRGGVG